MFKDLLLFTLRNFQRRKLRTVLTTLGIVIGIATIVSLLLLGRGMEYALQETFQKLGVSNIRVVPEGLTGPPTAELGLDKKDAEFIATITGVEYVDQVLANNANVEFAGETEFLETISFDTSIGTKGLGDLDLHAVEGRLFQLNEVDAVIVGNSVAKKLFDKDIYARNSIRINDGKFRVIGVFEKTGTDIDNRIMLPLDTARELFDKPDVVNAIVVKAQPGVDLDFLALRIEERLKHKRGDDDFKVYTPEKLLSQIQGIFTSVSAVLVAIAGISLVVGAVGIMNSLFTAVLERTKEIGVLKAVGASQGTILSLFLLESSFQGFVGGFVGCAAGFLFAFVLGLLSSVFSPIALVIRPDWDVFALGIGVAVVIGVFSGVIPAIRAARLLPVDALRYE